MAHGSNNGAGSDFENPVANSETLNDDFSPTGTAVELVSTEVDDAVAAALTQFSEASGTTPEQSAALNQLTNAFLQHSTKRFEQITDDAGILNFKSWHLAAVYAAAVAEKDGGNGLAKAAPKLVVSFATVFMQVVTCAAIFLGTVSPSCATNAQCERGTYCMGRVCQGCGGSGEGTPPLFVDPSTGLVYNSGIQPGTRLTKLPINGKDWAEAYNVSIVNKHCHPANTTVIYNWCHACYLEGEVNQRLFFEDVTPQNYKAMTSFGPVNWIVLILASSVVSVAVNAVLEDIEICQLVCAESAMSCTRIITTILSFTREWVFIPGLCGCVPWLVLAKGGDALSICFNTVSIIFIAEVDGGFYQFILSHRERSEVEHAAERASQGLYNDRAATRTFRVLLIITFVLFTLLVCGNGTSIYVVYYVAVVSPFLVMLVSKLADARGQLLASAYAFASFLGGLLIFGVTGLIMFYLLFGHLGK